MLLAFKQASCFSQTHSSACTSLPNLFFFSPTDNPSQWWCRFSSNSSTIYHPVIYEFWLNAIRFIMEGFRFLEFALIDPLKLSRGYRYIPTAPKLMALCRTLQSAEGICEQPFRMCLHGRRTQIDLFNQRAYTCVSVFIQTQVVFSITYRSYTARKLLVSCQTLSLCSYLNPSQSDLRKIRSVMQQVGESDTVRHHLSDPRRTHSTVHSLVQIVSRSSCFWLIGGMQCIQTPQLACPLIVLSSIIAAVSF